MQSNEYLQDMSGLEYLVIDEADRMIESGHFQELHSILGVLPQLSEEQRTSSGVKKRQTFLYSATLMFTPHYKKNKSTTPLCKHFVFSTLYW